MGDEHTNGFTNKQSLPRSSAMDTKLLTVHHLKNTVVANQSQGKLVLHVHHIGVPRRPLGQSFVVTLVPLARRIDVVTSREIGVDGTVDRVAFRPRERVLVEAFLPWDACSTVSQLCGVADEKLQMPLCFSGRETHVRESGGLGRRSIISFEPTPSF